jgi:hypothetical protein
LPVQAFHRDLEWCVVSDNPNGSDNGTVGSSATGFRRNQSLLRNVSAWFIEHPNWEQEIQETIARKHTNPGGGMFDILNCLVVRMWD